MSEPVRLLLPGDSGTGKTGSLISLVKAGYKVRVLDFDNGSNLVRNLLRRENPDLLSSFHSVVCTDPFKNVNGRLIPKPKAWMKGLQLLSHWKGGSEEKGTLFDLGKMTDWRDDTVVVIDSLDRMGDCCMRYLQGLSQKLGEAPRIQDWGTVQTFIRNLLELFSDEEITCHSIFITHIDKRYEDVKNDKGMVIERRLIGEFPNAPGRALPEQIGAYFNDCLQAVTEGSGSAQRRKLTVAPPGFLGLKTSNPGLVKKSYSIETGLAEFFKDVQA